MELQPMYQSFDEKELLKMWQDIKGGDVRQVCRSLMKDIARNEEPEAIWKVGQEEPIYRKRMWDSIKGEWVPFDLFGAYSIVNDRKEYVVAQIFRAVDVQPEYGPTLRGWCSIDTSILNRELKRIKCEGETCSEEGFSQIGIQAFKELIKPYNTEYLASLHEWISKKEDPSEKFNEIDMQNFQEMVKQDQQELRDEGRYDELNGNQRYRRLS